MEFKINSRVAIDTKNSYYHVINFRESLEYQSKIQVVRNFKLFFRHKKKCNPPPPKKKENKNKKYNLNSHNKELYI